MNPFLRNDYFSEQFKNATSNDYEYFTASSFYRDALYIKKHGTIPNAFNNVKKIKDLKPFLVLCEKHQPSNIESNDNYLSDFFILYASQNKDKINDLLKFYTALTRQTLVDQYQKIFPLIFDNKKDIISAISQLPTKSFYLSGEGLEQIYSFFNSYNLTQQEKKDIFFNYFHTRKSLLKDTSVATFSKNFILKHWEKDTNYLEKYFEFMPFLKTQFNQDKPDIFDNITQIVSNISLSKLKTNLCLDNFNDSQYIYLIKNFTTIYCKNYHINSIDFETSRCNKDTFRIIMKVKNPSFTKELFQNKLTNFLSFHKKTNQTNLTLEDIQAWVLKEQLQNNLKEKQTHKVLKI